MNNRSAPVSDTQATHLREVWNLSESLMLENIKETPYTVVNTWRPWHLSHGIATFITQDTSRALMKGWNIFG